MEGKVVKPLCAPCTVSPFLVAHWLPFSGALAHSERLGAAVFLSLPTAPLGLSDVFLAGWCFLLPLAI